MPFYETKLGSAAAKKSPGGDDGAGARKPTKGADAVDVFGAKMRQPAHNSLRPFVAGFRQQNGATSAFQ
jgi:hypothetical protein